MQNTRSTATFLRLVTIFICFICSTALAQNSTSPKPATTVKTPAQAINGPAILIEKFFKSYDKESTTKAMINIFKTNQLIDSNSLVKLIAKIDTTRSIIGPYLGKDLILQHKASNSLVLYSYLVKHQTQPIRFTFMFYKPKNDWIIYRLYFDDRVDTELEQSAKISGKP